MTPTHAIAGFERQNQHSSAGERVGEYKRSNRGKQTYERSPSLAPYEVVLSDLVAQRGNLPGNALYLHKLYRHTPLGVFCHLCHLVHASLGNHGQNDQASREGISFRNPDPFREILTVLQILQTYPSCGFARSGQSVMKC